MFRFIKDGSYIFVGLYPSKMFNVVVMFDYRKPRNFNFAVASNDKIWVWNERHD